MKFYINLNINTIITYTCIFICTIASEFDFCINSSIKICTIISKHNQFVTQILRMTMISFYTPLQSRNAASFLKGGGTHSKNLDQKRKKIHLQLLKIVKILFRGGGGYLEDCNCTYNFNLLF